MSNKLDHGTAAGADKDPFAQLSQGIESSVRKKKALSDDAAGPLASPAHDVADPAQSKSSAAAAAVLMSHWSDQKAPTAPPIDTLTTADRMRMMDKRKVINDPKKAEPAEKVDAPSKAQSHE